MTQEPAEAQEEILKQYVEETLPRYLKALTKRLEVKDESNRTFLVGDSLTVVDFDCANLAFSVFLNEKCHYYKQQLDVLDHYPVV